MDSVVVEDDCGTDQSIVVSSIVEGGDIIQPLTERILGRVIAEPISNADGEEVYPIGHLIDEDSVKKIDRTEYFILESPITYDL